MTTQYDAALARSAMYEFLALSFFYPEEGRSALLLDSAQILSPVVVDMGWQEIEAALEGLSYKLGSVDNEALEREYIDIFGHTVSIDCAPYEGEYDQADVFQKSQTLADLASFYQAFGVGPNQEFRERLDHVSVEMEFMHLLTLKEAYAGLHDHGTENLQICREAQEAFLDQHLAPWIASFSRRLGRKAGETGVYASLTRVLAAHMDREFTTFGISASPDQPLVIPIMSVDDQTCDACPAAFLAQ